MDKLTVVNHKSIDEMEPIKTIDFICNCGLEMTSKQGVFVPSNHHKDCWFSLNGFTYGLILEAKPRPLND